MLTWTSATSIASSDEKATDHGDRELPVLEVTSGPGLGCGGTESRDVEPALARMARGDLASERGGDRPPAFELGRGAMLGPYIVVDQLGAGGMGVVYAAYDPRLDRRVAVKLLQPEARGRHGDEARARLLREAQ